MTTVGLQTDVLTFNAKVGKFAKVIPLVFTAPVLRLN